MGSNGCIALRTDRNKSAQGICGISSSQARAIHFLLLRSLPRSLSLCALYPQTKTPQILCDTMREEIVIPWHDGAAERLSIHR